MTKPPKKKNKPGPAKGQGGAPRRSTKVRITWRIEPETKAWILAQGDPGEVLDRMASEARKEA